MTAKDFVLVCLVAGIAGAAAAFAIGTTQDPGPPAGVSDELAARLDRIETSLARAAETQKESKDSVAHLSERVTGLQMDLATARDEAKAAQAAAAAAQPADGEESVKVVRAKRTPTFTFGNAGQPGLSTGRFVTSDGSTLGGAVGTAMTEEIAKRLEAVSQGMRLRMLPEADRWKKAQDDLRLSDGQVEFLKTAISDRDKALKEMMHVETSADGGGGSRITIRRLDPEKAAEANREYERKVAQSLDSEQKKSWDERGYANAFGSPGGMGGAVLVAQSIDVTTDDAKSGGK